MQGKNEQPNQFIYTKEIRKILGIKFKPFVRSHKKIQRNDLCSCGSGLKYKICCLELDNMNNENK